VESTRGVIPFLANVLCSCRVTLSAGFSGGEAGRLEVRRALFFPVLGRPSSLWPVRIDGGSDVCLLALLMATYARFNTRGTRAYFRRLPLHGLMTSRYRGERSYSPLTKAARNWGGVYAGPALKE